MEHTLLIVDDEKDIVTMLKCFFSRRGYQVTTAFSGEEAVKKQRNAQI